MYSKNYILPYMRINFCEQFIHDETFFDHICDCVIEVI